MRILITTLCLLFSGLLQATETIYEHEVTLPAEQFLSSGMLNKAPVAYVWNKQGEPISLYELEEMRNSFANLEKQEALSAQPEHKGFTFLQDYLSSYDIWQSGKGIIVLHVIDPQLSACPPCEEAEAILEAFYSDNQQNYVLIKTQMVY